LSELLAGPMHTASSAKRTCRLWRSASEYTATVLMPRSLHAQITRRAISPRFAIRTLRNMFRGRGSIRPDGEKRLTIFDGPAIFDMVLHDHACHLGFDFVHQLHGFNDAKHLL